MAIDKTIYESGEMYLETILLLKDKLDEVRSVDIIKETNKAKSSVSKAVNILVDKKYINKDDRTGIITFTESGRKRAEEIYNKHVKLREMFIKIGVDEETAEHDACKIEHIISDSTFEKLQDVILNKK